jgi:aminopeptidase N
MLDEGFTQFLTSWSLESIDGKNIIGGGSKHNFLTCEPDEQLVRESRVYSSYMVDAMIDEDPSINTHSDGFNGALGQGGGYRHVYSKTATMLYNLQYVLGDSLFSGAMKHYFKKWSFCHPYIEDFRQSIIEYTHSDLNWFFDQWIETSKHVDYKIVSVKATNSPDSFSLKLKRLGSMQMPIDLQITGQSGKTYNFYIPNTWFEKHTNGTTLPRWIGWDNKLKTTYETTIHIPEPIKNAVIDTTERLADINELNNSLKFPLKLRMEDFLNKNFNRQQYIATWRPDVWYNNFDGIKAGIHFEGDYMRIFHKINFDLWANTGIGQGMIRPVSATNAHDVLSFRLSYISPTVHIMKQSYIDLLARFLDGIGTFKFGITKQVNENLTASLFYKALYKLNKYSQDYQYLWYQWNDYSLNSTLNLNLKYRKITENNLDYKANLNFRASILTSKNYSYIENEHIIQKRDRLFSWKARVYGRIGLNDNNTYTNESNLNAGGANGEQMIENEFTRAVTMFPSSLITSNNIYQMQKIHLSGGLNLRGYSLQQGIIQNTQGNIISLANQNTGYAANIQINFEKLSPLKFRKISPYVGLETYLFADGGQLGYLNLVESGMSFNKSPWLADAGLGCAIEIRRWGSLEKIKPLTFRLDMPLWLSHPGYSYNNLLFTQNQSFDFRFLIGIDKAF